MPLNTIRVYYLPALLLKTMAPASPPHPRFLCTPWKVFDIAAQC